MDMPPERNIGVRAPVEPLKAMRSGLRRSKYEPVRAQQCDRAQKRPGDEARARAWPCLVIDAGEPDQRAGEHPREKSMLEAPDRPNRERRGKRQEEPERARARSSVRSLRHVQDPLAEALVAGRHAAGSTVKTRADGGIIRIE
jgi:hypothetical protein